MDSRLIRLLDTFTDKELDQLEPFVEVGFSLPAKRKGLLPLFQQIRTAFSLPDEEKENKLAALLQPTATNKANISYLTRIVEKYLVWQKLEEQPIYESHLLINALLERNLPNDFLAHHKKTQKEQKRRPKSSQFYQDQQRLAQDFVTYIRFKKSRPLQQKQDSYFKELLFAQDVNLVLQKLKQAVEMVNLEQIAPKHFDFLLRDEIVEISAQGMFQNIPLIQAYRNALLLLTRQEADDFEQFKYNLNESAKDFSTAEQNSLFTVATNFCIVKINDGEEQFADELLNIYEIMLNNRLVYDGKFIRPGMFKNIVSAGLRAKQFDWTINFIETCKKDISPDYRQMLTDLCIANFKQRTGEFQEAANILTQLLNLESYLELDRKQLLLKCWFELDEHNEFYTHADAFKGFLKTNKNISDEQKQKNRDFATIAIKTFKLKNGEGRETKQSIQRLLDKTVTADNAWLQEKLDEMPDS